MPLDDIDHRHLCWAKFKIAIEEELQRRPLNGTIWQDETPLSSAFSWAAKVVELREAGNGEIRFELRVDSSGESTCMGRS